MNKENCALKLVDEIILYYDARRKKHQITLQCLRGSTRAEVSHQTNNYLKRKHKTVLNTKGADWKFQYLLTLPFQNTAPGYLIFFLINVDKKETEFAHCDDGYVTSTRHMPERAATTATLSVLNCSQPQCLYHVVAI